MYIMLCKWLILYTFNHKAKMNTSRCHTLTGVFDNQNSFFLGLFFVLPNKNKAKIKNANGGNWVSCGELWFMDERDGLILVQIGRIR